MLMFLTFLISFFIALVYLDLGLIYSYLGKEYSWLFDGYSFRTRVFFVFLIKVLWIFVIFQLVKYLSYRISCRDLYTIKSSHRHVPHSSIKIFVYLKVLKVDLSEDYKSHLVSFCFIVKKGDDLKISKVFSIWFKF